MRKLAALFLTLVVSTSAFAGEMASPGVTGEMPSPGIVSEIITLILSVL